ncbi:MAG: phasin family protein [Rhizobacter sp.]
MTQPAEQFLNSAKTTMAELNDMTTTTLAGFGKLVELNMATAQAAMAEVAEQMQAGFAIKSPQDLTDVTGLVQPMAEKAAAYGRAVAGIVTETGTALTKATEAKFADMQAQAVASIEAAMKNAPTGSEGAVAAFKNAIAAGQASLATAQSQAKQAMDTAGKQFAAASDMATKATKSAGKTK